MAFSIFKSKLKLDKKPTQSAAQTESSTLHSSASHSANKPSVSGVAQPSPTRSLNSSSTTQQQQGVKGVMLPNNAASTQQQQSQHILSSSGSSQSQKIPQLIPQSSSATGQQRPPSSAVSQLTSSASNAGGTSLDPNAVAPPVAMDIMPEEPVSEEVLALRRHFSALGPLSRRHFGVGDTLGTGTFGRVRLVTYTNYAPPGGQTGQKMYFALKMLKKSEIIRLKQVEHIKAEKSILSSICHPFIVNLFITFQDPVHLHMLMEYVIGGELFSQLRKVGRFSNDTSRFYAAEIVLALQYLHSKDTVYRDLKPENLLIDSCGHIKITDFGFAKKIVDRTWTLCGTPEYLAPEIIQSKGHGKEVDWWALGILIYEMLAGYPPFFDENPFGIYQKILAGKIDFPKHFDPYAKDLVKKLLTADRTKRLGCLKDQAEDIKRHKWFAKVDWLKIFHKKVRPPHIPHANEPGDTSNFDKYPDSPDAHGAELSQKEKDQFNDF